MLPGIVTRGSDASSIDDIVEELEAFKAQIIDGSIVVPTAPEG